MLSEKEFNQQILTWANGYCVNNPELRWGQAVFNSTEELFGPEVARTSQFVYNTDCYHDDSKVNEFLNKCYDLYVINQKKPIDYKRVLDWWNTSHGENRENSRLELIKSIECE